jgi:hypothetical protein
MVLLKMTLLAAASSFAPQRQRAPSSLSLSAEAKASELWKVQRIDHISECE